MSTERLEEREDGIYAIVETRFGGVQAIKLDDSQIAKGRVEFEDLKEQGVELINAREDLDQKLFTVEEKIALNKAKKEEYNGVFDKPEQPEVEEGLSSPAPGFATDALPSIVSRLRNRQHATTRSPLGVDQYGSCACRLA